MYSSSFINVSYFRDNKRKEKNVYFQKDDYEELCLQEWSKAVNINLLMTVLVIITYELV